MRFLSTNSDIEAALASLLRRCKRSRWAVAWASSNAPGFKLLRSQRSKIDQLTIGTHFYQTDPDFIAAFMEHPNAQFVLNPSGVFHPKLYYFDHGGGRWDCLVGSPNFTQAAFSTNSETAVWISQDDSGAGDAQGAIVAALDRYRLLGTSVGVDDLEAYRGFWARQQKRLGPLSGTYASPAGSKKRVRPLLDVPLFTESWEQYFRRVKNDRKHRIPGRLAILEEAARLFREHGRFSDMGDDGRRGIAGFGRTDELPWLWFGSMKGYCNHQMLALACVDANWMASGTWMNVRSFPPNKFRAQYDEEIKQRAIWFYCPQSLSEYKLPFLDIAKKQGVLAQMAPPPSFGSAHADVLFSGVQPTTVRWTEQSAFRHYLQTLWSQVKGARLGTFDDTADAHERLLDAAESLLLNLQGVGVRGQLRDFRDAIDVNRAALSVIRSSRGPMLRRKWSTL